MEDIFVRVKEKKENVFIQVKEDIIKPELYFEFLTGAEEIIEITVDNTIRGIYNNETLTNVATVEYQINDVVSVLPLTVVLNDVLKLTITRTNSFADSKVILNF